MTDALAIGNSYWTDAWVGGMDATRDEEIAALERRIAALAAMQKKMLDAVVVLGLNAAAWDPEEAAEVLRELGQTLKGMHDSVFSNVSVELFRDAELLIAPKCRLKSAHLNTCSQNGPSDANKSP